MSFVIYFQFTITFKSPLLYFDNNLLMIIIKLFASFNRNLKYETYEALFELKKDKDYLVKYKFTNGDDFTHVIILNVAMPNLINIPNKNVIGLSCEPLPFLGLTKTFIQYAEQNIGMYLLGDAVEPLTDPFVLGFPCMPLHIQPKGVIPPKSKLMSIMVSNKAFAPGHKYRHDLVHEIVRRGLPIDIYGRGCNYYKDSQRDSRFKGEFEQGSDVLYKDYKFHIAIENFSCEHYLSEKIKNPLLCGTVPIYWGCRNIEQYFPGQYISLSGNLVHDIQMLSDICSEPEKYLKVIDIEKVRETISIKNIIKKQWLKV